MRDPYDVLGVSRSASDDEIKKHTISSQENIIPTISQVQAVLLPRVRKRR